MRRHGIQVTAINSCIVLISDPETGFPLTIHIERISDDPLRLNCISTGFPPTEVTFYRDDNVIVPDDTHQITQYLTDGRTTTYSNVLTVNQDLEDTEGSYDCVVTAISQTQSTIEQQTIQGQQLITVNCASDKVEVEAWAQDVIVIM